MCIYEELGGWIRMKVIEFVRLRVEVFVTFLISILFNYII